MTCPYCGGTGVIYENEEEHVCPECDGVGAVRGDEEALSENPTALETEGL